MSYKGSSSVRGIPLRACPLASQQGRSLPFFVAPVSLPSPHRESSRLPHRKSPRVLQRVKDLWKGESLSFGTVLARFLRMLGSCPKTSGRCPSQYSLPRCSIPRSTPLQRRRVFAASGVSLPSSGLGTET